ncbi:hypothetical protein QSV34_01095 [Porticoccus sp. W117]|uniref:hypothetical protein n=1 Tax=Porticoccus sp. W117 TaxID=3054777 RepID=UPI00259A4226|nr:hypothetical protein [Porticoccus sp. W117]MDM3869941.1 hypothetical protein [Porticoccus sp. W117]
MKTPNYLFVWLFCVLSLAGCTNNDSPQAVSKQFWQAMAAGDVDAAKALATKGSMDGISISDDRRIEGLHIGDVSLGENEQTSLVATSFDSVNNNSRITLSFDTVVEQHQGQWRVNFTRTTQSMLGSSFQQLQDALAETISEAGDAIGEAVDGALDDAVREMSSVLQDTARDMQQAADDIRAELEQLKQNDAAPIEK